MNDRQLRRQTTRAVRKVLKSVPFHDAPISKVAFEGILNHLIEQIHRDTGLDRPTIAGQTSAVMRAFPQEYGRLDESLRSWEAVLSYLYIKYLQEVKWI